MNKQLFLYLALLVSSSTFAQGVVINEEDYAPAEQEVKGEALIIELDTETAAGKKNKPVPSRRSINMIVGGQSQDGLAKQSTLPVDD